MSQSQCEALIKHMQRKPITSMAAYENYGITSLHRRLSDLKARGYVFDSETIKEKNRWGENVRFNRYYLVAWPL